MSTRINYTGSTAFGKMLAEFVSQVKAAQAKGQRLKDAMDSMSSGGSYGQIESEVGVPAGQGQPTYNLVTGAVAAINVAAVNQLTLLDNG